MPKSKCTRSSSGDDKTSSTTCSSHSLKKNVLGVPQVAFFILAIVGPLMTMLGGATFAYLAIGVAVPAAYLISGLIALCFAVGYLALARRLISAGGFVSLIARALGERAGNAAAFVSLLIFNAVLMMLLGAFSTFTSGLFQAMLGIKISWPWCAAALLATGAFLGYRDIELSAKILGFLMLAEVVVLLVFDISVITRGGRLSGSGFSFESFYPENIFTSAIGLGLLWCLGCFGGFEVGFMYSEEAREPEKTIPRATYLALALLVVFYTFTTWAVVNGYDGQNMQASVAQSMQGFLFSITTRYVGVFWTDLMRILVCTGYLAAYVGVQNAASRYLFALGRGGVFPGKLANIHPKYKSPYVGNIVQTAVTALLFIACVAQGADAFRHLFGIGGGLANMGSQTMYLLVSLSAIVFFRRFGITENESLWKTVTAPALAIALAGMIIVLTIIKFDILTENAGWVRWIWITIPIALILGYSASYFGGRKTGMAAAFNPKFVNNRPMEID